jgi:tetratricopeptide (TPR) repeat protein
VIRTQDIFETASPSGIIGDELIADQIHPTINGQALMALELIKIIYEEDMLAPKEQWRWDRIRPVDAMEDSVGLDPDIKVEIYLSLAGFVKRHYDKAAQLLEKALSIKPDSIYIQSWLAHTYWENGEKQKAIDVYRRLYEAMPLIVQKKLTRNPRILIELAASCSNK